MLELLTTSTRVLTLPLPSDPALVDANTLEALTLYYQTGDADGLTIPPACLTVEIRALSAAEKRAAHEAAGRPPMRGEVLHQQANAAEDAPAFVDAMTDADYAAVRRYLDWSRRFNAEVVRRACLRFGSDTTGAELVAAVAANPSERGEGVIAEVAGLIARVGSVGKATPPFCATSSGEASITPGGGSAEGATAPSPSGLPATA